MLRLFPESGNGYCFGTNQVLKIVKCVGWELALVKGVYCAGRQTGK